MTFLANQPKAENAVAYCHNPSHVGYLSPAIMKKHECLRKGCKYLHVYEDRAYWERREKKKRAKKFRRFVMNEDWEMVSEYIAELIGEHYEQERPET